jgi:hypothetical protein
MQATTEATISYSSPKRLLRRHIQLMEQMIPEVEIVETKYKDPVFNEMVKQGHLKQQRAQVPRLLDRSSAKVFIYFKKLQIRKQKVINLD